MVAREAKAKASKEEPKAKEASKEAKANEKKEDEPEIKVDL